jgi:hypothetical protein
MPLSRGRGRCQAYVLCTPVAARAPSRAFCAHAGHGERSSKMSEPMRHIG